MTQTGQHFLKQPLTNLSMGMSPPDVLLILGTDASGKNHVANFSRSHALRGNAYGSANINGCSVMEINMHSHAGA